MFERTANVVRAFLVPSGAPRAVAGAPGPWVHGRLELRLARPQAYPPPHDFPGPPAGERGPAGNAPGRSAVTHAEEERYAARLAEELEPHSMETTPAPPPSGDSESGGKKRGNGKGRKST